MSTSIITKPDANIAPDLLDKIKESTEEQGQVVLHFVFQNTYPWPTSIRIWPTTYLFDRNSDHQSELVHFENITLWPTWKDIDPMSNNYFTLIFSGLPKSCTSFDFEEQCTSQGGEFFCRNISRNDTDVYFLQIT